MMRFRWQVLLGTELGTHKGVPRFASIGHGELRAVLQDAYDKLTSERACDRTRRWPWLSDGLSLLHSSSPCSTCAHRENTWHGARCNLIANASFVKLLWACCGTDSTSAPHLQSSDANFFQDLNLDTWLDRMPLSGVAGACSGQDVTKPIRHEHVVWELRPENGELDTRGFGDGSPETGA